MEAPSWNVRVSEAQYQPTDRPIEDRISVVQGRKDRRIVAGVFDGHGGAHTAEYLRKNLPEEILKTIPLNASSETISEALLHIFESFDNRILSDFTETFHRFLRIPIQALRLNQIGRKLEHDPAARAVVDRAKSGSTALIAFIERGNVYLANTGDCRAVMGRMGANGHSVYAAQMTVDLNTKNQSERARLAAKDEQFALVGDRVLGQIGVTRSFGDAFFKLKNTEYTHYVFGHSAMTRKGKISMHETHQHLYKHIISPPYLIPTPEISHLALTSDDRFLILASDGFWDTPGISMKWVATVVTEAQQNGNDERAAQYILDRLRERGSPGDDVSIIVLLFGDAEVSSSQVLSNVRPLPSFPSP